MKPSALLTVCVTTALAATIPSTKRIPTAAESAVLGRRILALTPLATLSTIFPTDNAPVSGRENRPASVAGMPHGLMEYIADCDDSDSGNPTILAISIETSFLNAAAGSNMSVSVNWVPPHPPVKRIQSRKSWWDLVFRHGEDAESEVADPLTYSAAALPRFSLLGYVERIEGGDESKELAKCFVKSHPDARYWLPGNRIHESHFVRLVVKEVYWIGGFGDRAYIGWIPIQEWKKVKRAEWEAVRLPGEKKGWKEWNLDL
ncbi:pyridoxamine 5'-phosphate oxidase-domain-containing protein [Podospora aff. communis PSN243]|uniref:Pyridoxamine 5'-phosphate oxidase-domain-containing protein n=1 Tax=Podospora aff. communis PSN243 TaxID=3040156 RepID=A0AAV9H0G5_9PEZI|nr:pyridoxamine 5'-phosphate oxidase-domain-containing protein [Podospora aff. communis PSN243]